MRLSTIPLPQYLCPQYLIPAYLCLRAEGEEADQDNDEQASVDPEGENRKRAVQGGEMHWLADAKRADGAPRSDVPKQQREGSRHGGQKRRAQREGAEGGQKRTGGRAHRGNVQDDSIDPAWDPAGSFSGDDETRDRQRRETVTETREKRYLKKRTREGGSNGGALATALDAADD